MGKEVAWRKGQSGNPGGRPKRDKLITQRVIAELTDADGAKLHRLVVALVDKACAGDIAAIREVIDRVEGKAVQALDHSGHVEYEPTGAREAIARMLAGIAGRLEDDDQDTTH